LSSSYIFIFISKEKPWWPKI